jgi:hypothetical protein
MLYLPKSRSTPALISFGIVTAGLGFVVCLLAHAFLIASPLWFVAALGWLTALGGVLAWNVLWLEKPYGLYNRLIERVVIRPIRCWILAVTFGVVMLANRPFAGRMRDLREGRDSTWHDNVTQNLLDGAGSTDVAIDETPDTRWLSAWIGWIRQTGRWWMLGLTPFVLALAIFDTGEEPPKVSGETYSLY